MNRLFVDFTQYSYGATDNHSHAFVGTLDKTIHLGESITKSSRRRIEKLVSNAAALGYDVTLNISNLSMWVTISRMADNKAEQDANMKALGL